MPSSLPPELATGYAQYGILGLTILTLMTVVGALWWKLGTLQTQLDAGVMAREAALKTYTEALEVKNREHAARLEQLNEKRHEEMRQALTISAASSAVADAVDVNNAIANEVKSKLFEIAPALQMCGQKIDQLLNRFDRGQP